LPGLEKKAGEQLAFTEEIVLPEGSLLYVEDKIQEGDFQTDKDIIIKDAGGKINGVLAHPIAYDGRTNLPDPEISDLLDLTYYVQFVKSNVINISVLVPADWLNDPQRMYPVTIDPWLYESYWYDDGFQMDYYNMNYSYQYMMVGQSYYGYPFYMAYMMWRGIPIPRYSTINGMAFYCTPYFNYSYDNNCSWEWRFEYTGNALPCYAQLPSNRTYSYWYNYWINFNYPWTAGSPIGFGFGDNGRLALQEIVNRYDWNPGNSIGMKWGMYPYYPNNYRLIYSREISDYYAPQLYIDYQAPLQPPANVQATNGAYANKIQITWESSYGATDYKVYRSTNNDPNSASYIGGTSNLYYDDTSPVIFSIYYYWVKAHNGGGDSNFSNGDPGWLTYPTVQISAPSTGHLIQGSSIYFRVYATQDPISVVVYYTYVRSGPYDNTLKTPEEVLCTLNREGTSDYYSNYYTVSGWSYPWLANNPPPLNVYQPVIKAVVTYAGPNTMSVIQADPKSVGSLSDYLSTDDTFWCNGVLNPIISVATGSLFDYEYSKYWCYNCMAYALNSASGGWLWPWGIFLPTNSELIQEMVSRGYNVYSSQIMAGAEVIYYSGGHFSKAVEWDGSTGLPTVINSKWGGWELIRSTDPDPFTGEGSYGAASYYFDKWE
jgi:hypothetical protein